MNLSDMALVVQLVLAPVVLLSAGSVMINGAFGHYQALNDRLQAMCRELAVLGVPLTLEHGDLWGVNVIAGARDCVFIDWEDATIAHPFLSVFLLLASPEHTDALRELPDAHARIRAAYLGPWRQWAADEGWPAGKIEQAGQNQRANNNLKEIGIGAINFHDTNGAFPNSFHRPSGGKAPPTNPDDRLSWRVSLLPYTNNDFVYKTIVQEQAWNSAANRTAANTPLAV